MTKAELIERIAKSRNLSPEVSKKLIQQILDLAFEELGSYFTRARVGKSQAPRFTYPGFGTFTKKRRSARKGVNPRTLEPIEIDASFTVDFRPGLEFRRGLNGGSDERARPAVERLQPAAEETEPPTLGRRLRSRDEVELEGDDPAVDPSLFGASEAASRLPEAPLQRVRGDRRPARKAKTSAS